MNVDFEELWKKKLTYCKETKMCRRQKWKIYYKSKEYLERMIK